MFIVLTDVQFWAFDISIYILEKKQVFFLIGIKKRQIL